jgi:hypothetical protein
MTVNHQVVGSNPTWRVIKEFRILFKAKGGYLGHSDGRKNYENNTGN